MPLETIIAASVTGVFALIGVIIQQICKYKCNDQPDSPYPDAESPNSPLLSDTSSEDSSRPPRPPRPFRPQRPHRSISPIVVSPV